MARQEADFYPTPEALAPVLCREVERYVPDPTYIIEPSAGDGVFIRAARNVWPGRQIVAIDVRDTAEKCMSSGATYFWQGDWEEYASGSNLTGAPLVIGNPPFSLAREHILAGLDSLYPGSHIAFLLKMNFLGGKKRAQEFWPAKQLKAIVPFTPRPSFIKGAKASNDTNEYGCFIWQVGYTGPAEIVVPPIIWR